VDGAGEGVMSTPPAVSFRVRVMVPETVPTCTAGTVELLKATWVELAATVKLAVRPPVVKTTSWPSSGDGASGAKVKVTVPVIASGYALGMVIPRGGCVAGAAVAGNPVIVADGPGGTPTVRVNDFVAVWTPSVTETVKVNVPGADGIPLREPGFRAIPAGSAPEAIDQVKGAAPPARASAWL
jgi:hypothetical protein